MLLHKKEQELEYSQIDEYSKVDYRSEYRSKIGVVSKVLQFFEIDYDFILRFSKRLKPFNAYIKLSSNKQQAKQKADDTNNKNQKFVLVIVANYEWLSVSDAIFQGMLEDLLFRVFKDRVDIYLKNLKKFGGQINVRLYNNFINQLSRVIARTNIKNNKQSSYYNTNLNKTKNLKQRNKTKQQAHIRLNTPLSISHLEEDILTKSFERVNRDFFNNTLDQPEMFFSGNSKTVLASYDYTTHTIKFSNAVKKLPEHLIDYIMLHELLHYSLGFRFKIYDQNNQNHAVTTCSNSDMRVTNTNYIDTERTIKTNTKRTSEIEIKTTNTLSNNTRKTTRDIGYRYYHDKVFRLKEKLFLASKGLSKSKIEREISKYLKTKA